ncbi:ParB/RepB/Spo0J family partition protein [bacterium]|nr:ParB/RepB/Spo0J family partition protein [bacterium]
MTKNRPGLGRGLAELLPAAAPPRAGESVQELPIELIDPNPYQPRHEFDPAELAELAASIKSQGLLQPVTVRPSPGSPGRYQLIAGERRLRASRELGLSTIKAIVRNVEDRQLMELSLVENLLRTDLNEIEVAEALLNLMNQYAYTTTRLAEVLGKSRPAVSNTLRLLELPRGVQELIRRGQLSAGHGRAVLSFPQEQRDTVALEAAQQGLSVRQLERRSAEAAQREVQSRPRRSRAEKASAPDGPDSAGQRRLRQAERQLTEHLATKVSVQQQGEGGSIAIAWYSDEDLQRLLDLLLGSASPF